MDIKEQVSRGMKTTIKTPVKLQNKSVLELIDMFWEIFNNLLEEKLIKTQIKNFKEEKLSSYLPISMVSILSRLYEKDWKCLDEN